MRGYARITQKGAMCSDCGRFLEDVRWFEDYSKLLCRTCLRDAQEDAASDPVLDDWRRFSMGL